MTQQAPEILNRGSHKWTVIFPGSARSPMDFRTKRAAQSYLRDIYLPVQAKRAAEKQQAA